VLSHSSQAVSRLVDVTSPGASSHENVARAERYRQNGHGGAVVWLAGLSGAGKSTLAFALERVLFDKGWRAFVLDGDIVRAGLNADLGFSAVERTENGRRVAEVARLLAEVGTIAICALISPYGHERMQARRRVESAGIPFVEVYVSTPLEVCEARDPKKLYARARAGEIEEFTGIASPFEVPETPNLAIDTSQVSISKAVALLIDELARRVEWHPTGTSQSLAPGGIMSSKANP
jgi:adenylyl-sulfate kinase